jgi:hypothetical protein
VKRPAGGKKVRIRVKNVSASSREKTADVEVAGL